MQAPIQCQGCGEIFTRKKACRAWKPKFCSRKCAAKRLIGSKPNAAQLAGLAIGQEIHPSPETRRKSSEAKIGELNPGWRGGTYRRRVLRGPGRKLVHRRVVEDSIGRELKRREVIHHWNEDQRDNAPSNLALLRHQGAHNRLHAFAARNGIKVIALKFEQPWLTNESPA